MRNSRRLRLIAIAMLVVILAMSFLSLPFISCHHCTAEGKSLCNACQAYKDSTSSDYILFVSLVTMMLTILLFEILLLYKCPRQIHLSLFKLRVKLSD
ncbi:MAG: hypothetical protein IJA82_07845 [Clostridia bacterium]|nr:hypothetical protein [Clostridia bacterium]